MSSLPELLTAKLHALREHHASLPHEGIKGTFTAVQLQERFAYQADLRPNLAFELVDAMRLVQEIRDLDSTIDEHLRGHNIVTHRIPAKAGI